MEDSWKKQCYKYCKGSKSKKNSNKKNHHKQFWGNDDVISRFTTTQIHSKEFISAIASYLQQSEYRNPLLLPSLIETAPNNVAFALRSSEVFIRPNLREYHTLLKYSKQPGIVGDTIVSLQQLSLTYHHLKNQKDKLLQFLSKQDSVDVLLWSSIIFVEHQIKCLDSSDYDLMQQELQSDIEIISTILSTCSMNPSHFFDFALKNGERKEDAIAKIMSKLVGSEPLTISKISPAYRNAFTAIRNFNHFAKGIWEPYSFEHSFIIDNNSNYLIQTINRAQEWDRANQKMKAESRYWRSEIEFAFQHEGQYDVLYGSKENSELNRSAAINAFSGSSYASNAYGISNIIFCRSNKVRTRSIFLFLQYLNAFFYNDYLLVFNKFYKSGVGLDLTLLKMLRSGMNMSKFRCPLHIYDIDEFFDVYKKFVLDGTREEFDGIINLLSFDISNAKSTLFTHPFIIIGKSVIIFPYLLPKIDVNRGLTQNLIYQQSQSIKGKHSPRKDEVGNFEQMVGKYFSLRDFKVVTGLKLYDYGSEEGSPLSAREIGEIDVLAYRDGHLFLLEIKTTKIEISPKDIFNHIESDLKYADIQLDTVLSYITNNRSEFNELMKSNNILDSPHELDIHTLIIDTTFEADHEMIGKHIKLSHLELRIALYDNLFHMMGRSMLPERLKHTFDTGIEIDFSQSKTTFTPSTDEANEQVKQVQKYILYPNGFSIARFLEIIHNQLVWRYLDDDYPISNEAREQPLYKIPRTF